MTDLHDLIHRMADELDHYRMLLCDDRTERHALATEARAALAEPQGEGPTDDSAEEWQWYTYCPEEGIELYPNRQQAQSAAQSIMGSYEVAAHSDGWHEDMELVSWGMLVPVEHAQVVARGPADSGSGFDEWVRYELKAVARWGRPAPLPADDGPAVPEGREPASVVGEATAALAEPPVVTIGALLRPAYEPGDGSADGAQMVGMAWWHPVMGCDSLQIVADNARAALARYGRPTPQPADGEVGAVAAWLRAYSDEEFGPCSEDPDTRWLKRAAELLERLASPACVMLKPSPETIEAFQASLPGRVELLPDDAQAIEPAERTVLVPALQPISVSERLPGPEDCDGDGEVWAWRRFDPEGGEDNGDYWCLAFHEWLEDEDCCFTHWLPAHALPLPREVQP